MDKTIEQLEFERNRQYQALSCLNDEVMSKLHAHPLRQSSIESKHVIAWLQLMYDEIQAGLGKPRHFRTVE
jgi:hypothetical protein